MAGKEKAVSKQDVEPGATLNSKDKLLLAAFEVFSTHGYHGATTKLIAQTAQVNEALIMRHFKSKEGLFLAVIERNVTCEMCTLDYPEQATVEEELYKFAAYIIERDRKKNDFLRILIGHTLQDKEFMCRADEQVIDKRKPVLSPRLEKFQKNGQIKKDIDLSCVEEMMMGIAFTGNFFNRLVAVNDDQETMDNLRFAAKTVAAGLKP